jgi:hypothetical protein
MIRKTLAATSGIELKNKFDKLDCEECKISKAKRGHISRGKDNTKDVLDVVEIDVQGPFPLVANDGTEND